MLTRCKAITRKGARCKRTATVGDYCVAHTDDPERSITKHLVPGPHPDANGRIGRPRRPREIELIEEVAEEKRDELRAVYTDGLVADRALVVGNGPTARIEFVPDHPHRLATAREILDRLHGKPTANGEGSAPTQQLNLLMLVTNDDLRAKAADLGRAIDARRADDPGRIESVGLDAAG